jgi:uncharacterized protein YsxB (DUF464 family)
VIRARLVLDKKGTIRRFEATGHAGTGAPGFDLACAAFSALARSSYRALEALGGIELKGDAAEPGTLHYEVLGSGAETERAAGIADFLVVGLSDLARDFPRALSIEIERDWEE